MRTRRRLDHEQLAVCCLVVVVHAAVLWLLTRQADPHTSRDTSALQVHWIERPRIIVPEPDADPPAPTAARERASILPPRAEPTRPADERASEPASREASEQPATLSIVVLEQARRWAEAQAPIGDFSRDPLAGRQYLVAGIKADRFRMREAITAAQVVRGIGTLFGGPAYTTDPCPRVRENLANLGTGSEHALVDEEVRRLRRLCQ